MEQTITLFTYILFSLYVYVKIFNLQINVVKAIPGLLFSGLLAYGVVLLKTPLPYLRYVLLVLALGLFAGILTGTKIDSSLIGAMVSSGFSYGIAFISIFIATLLVGIVFDPFNNIAMMALSFALQLASVFFLFKIKRFKKGIPFLRNKSAGIIGLFSSGLIVTAAVLIGGDHFSDELVSGIVAGSGLCIVGLVAWWRSGITKLYRQRIRERGWRELEGELAEKDRLIGKLRENNDFLASLIHRDNKLLPAMYEAVKAYLEGRTGDARTVLRQIEELLEERGGAIARDGRENKSLPTTKDTLIDGVMKHMLLKAAEEGIEFDITVIGDISELTGTVIPTVKFQTLCADLIENAIIATSDRETKKVFITLGSSDGAYELTVQDSGVPFDPATLMNLGLKKASSRLDEGGSGIGYMTVFEILREFKASLIITEYELPARHGFTKSVTARFDGRDGYIVETYRADEFPACDYPCVEPLSAAAGSAKRS
jgi:anti-sigma regulatory factor (Ser/Thr protein kinase)